MPDRVCADCGAEIVGNHAVRGGEPYCRDCVPLAPGQGLPAEGFEAPTTVGEYEASKATVVPVEALMDGGDPR